MSKAWTKELKFTEANYELLLSYLAKEWKTSNQQAFEFIMDWATASSWSFEESLYSYFYLYPKPRRYFLKLFNGVIDKGQKFTY